MRYVSMVILAVTLCMGPSVFSQDEKIASVLPPDAGFVSFKEVVGEKIAPVLPPDARLASSKKVVSEKIAPALPPDAGLVSSKKVVSEKIAPALSPDAGSASKQGLLETGVYQIDVGDVLDINVIQPVPIISTMIVTPDGTITFPYIGRVQAKDRTLSQIQSEIQDRLTRYLNYPVVSVSLKEARIKTFTIYGEVIHPGAYPLESDMSLLRAISLAGGLNVSGSTGVVKVLRPHKDGRGKSVIFESGITAVLSGTKQDVAILSGDTVIVTIDKFFIYGEVNHPGNYPVEENMSLLNAIIIAGGFTEGRSTGVVKLLRAKGSPKEMTLDIKAILSGEDQGLILQAGDTINVVADRFYIYGQIANPGAYPVGDNMSIMYAVTAAGGFVGSGSMGRVKIFHAKPQKNEDPILEFDINSILGAGNQNAIVRGGDTIVVSLDKFFITGQINHPGAYPVEKHMSLLNAISTAGGLTADNSTAKIKLLRTNADGEPGQQLETDFTSLLNGTAPDVSIQASDTIVVIANKFYVYGEVNRPGMYYLESKTTALTAISIAGGFDKFGSGNRVKIVRINEKTGDYEIIKVNIVDAIAGNSKADVQLMPGDVVSCF